MPIDYRSIPLGAQLSPPDQRDWHISRLSPVISKAFAESLEIPYPHIKNQGAVGSCVAHALSAFREIIEEKQSGKYLQLSPGFIYGMRKDTDIQGIGMYPRQALRELVDVGVCSNSLLPDNVEYPAIKDIIAPKKDALLKDAYPHRINAYAILVTTDDIKTALSNGWPVPITINVWDSFYKVTKSNPIVPIPDTSKESYVGGHEMLITGWREDNTWVVVNSWGAGWGDGGKCYIPIGSPIIIERWTGTDNILPPQPEPKKVYTLTMTTDKQSYNINELVMFKIHTSEPSQAVSCIFNRPSNPLPYDPKVTTDASGNFLLADTESVAGTLAVDAKWVDPNGDTQEVKMSIVIAKSEPTHDYNISVTYDKRTAYVGETINFTAHLTDNGVPQAGQVADIDLFAPESSDLPLKQTSDVNGDVKLQLVSTKAGNMDVIINWQDKGVGTGCMWLAKPEPEPEPEPEPTPVKSLYHVQVGAFGVKENADKLAAELKALGYPVFVVQYSSVIN